MQIAPNAIIGVTQAHVAEALRTLSEFNVSTKENLASWHEGAGQWLQTFLEAGAQPLFTPPAIGEYWRGQGGVYAGQVREDDGTCYHVILADAKPVGCPKWAAALKWAKTVNVDGRSDFELPTRRASALLYANLSHMFEKAWHWTSTEYSESFAWISLFSSGYQYSGHKDFDTCARAVRRFVA